MKFSNSYTTKNINALYDWLYNIKAQILTDHTGASKPIASKTHILNLEGRHLYTSWWDDCHPRKARAA